MITILKKAARHHVEGKAFTTIIREMSDAGDELVAHKYKFEEYGIPQKRHRIIIIGIKKELGLKFKVPKPFEYPISAKTALSDIPSHVSHWVGPSPPGRRSCLLISSWASPHPWTQPAMQ